MTALKTLYKEGGIPRFYRGLLPALAQGPLSRFGDTAANTGVQALMNSFDSTKDLPVSLKTGAASATAALWRIFLMPIDTMKTIMQVEGKRGLPMLGEKVSTSESSSHHHHHHHHPPPLTPLCAAGWLLVGATLAVAATAILIVESKRSVRVVSRCVGCIRWYTRGSLPLVFHIQLVGCSLTKTDQHKRETYAQCMYVTSHHILGSSRQQRHNQSSCL